MVPVVMGKELSSDVVCIVVVGIAATTGCGWRTTTNAIADSNGHMIAIIGDNVVGAYTYASGWHASVRLIILPVLVGNMQVGGMYVVYNDECVVGVVCMEGMQL
jgi:hypothetical protein